jgi:integrase
VRRPILSPLQYLRVRSHLAEPWRLLIDVTLEGACRWGELAELRVKDLDARNRELHIDRTVVELDKAHRPEGHDRFLIKDYPKNGTQRTVALSADLVQRLAEHLTAWHAQPEDLLFPRPSGSWRAEAASAATGPVSTFTRGARRFTHGTLYAYTIGQCRCYDCRTAISTYRGERRARALDRPGAPQAPDSAQRHLLNDWFRKRIWQPAQHQAGITDTFTIHDLRRTAATWSLHGGANIQQVRTMLGHKSLRSVERYLHEMPGTTNRNALEANHRARATWEEDSFGPGTRAVARHDDEDGPSSAPALRR